MTKPNFGQINLKIHIAQLIDVLVKAEHGHKIDFAEFPWLERQFDAMYRHHYLPESPTDYQLNRSGGSAQAITSVTPVTQRAWENRQDLYAAARGEPMRAFKALGLDLATRHQPVQTKHEPAIRDFVLTPGDFVQLRHFLEHFLANIGAPKKARKRLYVQNENDFWDPLLEEFKLSGPKARNYRHTFGIFLTANTASTIQRIKDVSIQPLMPQQGAASTQSAPVAFPDGVELFFLTSNGKKRLETTAIIKDLERAATIRNPDHILGYYECAEEISGTYSGNALEKMHLAVRRVIALGESVLRESSDAVLPHDATEYQRACWRAGVASLQLKAAERRGSFSNDKHLDPGKIVFLTNDTGFHIEAYDDNDRPVAIDLASAPEFAASAKYVPAGKPYPGVELNHVLDAMGGPQALFTALEKFRLRHQNDHRQRIRFRAVNKSTYLAMPLADEFEDITILSAHGSQEELMRPTPRPEADVYTTDHYQIPLIDNPELLTKAEMGTANALPLSSDARAIETLLGMLEIPASQHILDFKKNKTEIGWRTHLNTAGYEAVTNGDIDWKDPESILSILKNRNAFVFPLSGPTAPLKDEDFTRHLYWFSSLLVGRQTHQEHVDGKILACPGLDQPEHPYHIFSDIIVDLQNTFLVKQRSFELFDCTGSDDETARMIKDNLSLNDPYEDFPFQRETKGVPAPATWPGVAIIGSASTKVPEYLEEVSHYIRITGTAYAHKGIDFFTGGGRFGVMGEAHKAIDEVRKLYDGQTPCAIHRTEIQSPRTLHLEGAFTELLSSSKWDVRDQFIVTETIYPRMEEIIIGRPVVAFAGGVGTLQEISRKIILKMINPEERSIPLIIVNTDGRYNSLKPYFSEQFRRDNNIHFIDAEGLSPRAARDFLHMTPTEKAHWAAEAAARISFNYFETLKPRPPHETRTSAQIRPGTLDS